MEFTAEPHDVEPLGGDIYAAALAAGQVTAYVPPTAEEARAALPDLRGKQFRLGMRDLGVTSAMMDTALAAIADQNQREIAQIEWEDSDSYSRLHPLIAQLAIVLGKTDEQIDAARATALTYN